MTISHFDNHTKAKRTADAAESNTRTASIKTKISAGHSNIAINLLAILAVIGALYFARDFFVPLLIGILASYALRPLVDWLKALYIPVPLAAALVLFIFVGAASWMAYSLRDDATTFIEKLPAAAHKLRQRITDTRARGPSVLQHVQEATNELAHAAAEATGTKEVTPAVVVPETPSATGVRNYILAQSALVLTGLAQTPVVLLLTYFLLSSGEYFRRKIVRIVGPSLSRKKEMVHLLDEINTQVQHYLFNMLASSLLVGICTWLAFKALGMEQPGVWGVAAGILHFIPYLGAALVSLVSGLAALVQTESPMNALAVSGASLLIASVIGLVCMTWLQSRFAHMNTAVLFISLLFFGWLWGVWGMLVSAPLITIAKVICDRIESLKPVGELLGR
ncbi:MAG: AI-2E family transporter [Sulfuricaulis sp.]